MTGLTAPKLGTNANDWPFYSLHLMSAYVLSEYFRAFDYLECIAAAEDRRTEVGPWAVKMRSEGYHDLFRLSLVGMWAAFEAGIEDTAAAIVMNSHSAAASATSRYKKGAGLIQSWPWSMTVCTDIAKKLDTAASRATIKGGEDICGRLVTLFSWLGIEIHVEEGMSERLAEVSRVRNILVHRYGKPDAGDVDALPKLQPWQGQVFPITKDVFTNYYKTISNFLVSLMQAIQGSKHVKG